MGELSRYLAVERQVFAHFGVTPREQMINLRRVGGKARLLEIGKGEPLLLLAGGPNVAATFAPLLPELAGLRLLLLDRPGTGLSDPLPVPPDASRLPGYLVELVADALDALSLVRADVLGSSLGGSAILRAAAALPQRIGRVVLLGCPAFVPGWRQPFFFNLLRTPILGKLMLRLPAGRQDALRFLRGMGSGLSLERGRIPDHVLDLIVAWMADTETMRNDAAMIRACGTFTGGFDPSLDLTARELSHVLAPTLAVAGTEDPVGSVDVVRALAASVRQGEVAVIEGAGHLPWLDDPAAVGRAVRQFLSEEVTATSRQSA
jgi:2-hydroxy-6-oxonona-2,4-dienedioate hydrolase